MKLRNPFSDLTIFECFLWLGSVAAIAGSALLFGETDFLSVIASLIGVTSLIFLAKGYVLGQALIIVFGLIYGYISFRCRYYGEMITYVGMTAPVAAATLIEWLRHPYAGTREVEVAPLTPRKLRLVILLTAAVTAAFYWILAALNTANLPLSTFSVTTSFFAASLTYLRSPWYALGYAANDVVLIGLWVFASRNDPSSLPMVVCFVVFLINDLYGFFSWRAMQRRQST